MKDTNFTHHSACPLGTKKIREFVGNKTDAIADADATIITRKQKRGSIRSLFPYSQR